MAVIRPKKRSRSNIRWIIVVILLLVTVYWVVVNYSGGGGGGDSQILSAYQASDHVTKFIDPILEPKATSAGEQYPPLSCTKFLEAVKHGTSIPDPNKGEILQRKTVLPPPFQISVNNQQFDAPAWHIYEKGYYFETDLVQVFSSILNATIANRTSSSSSSSGPTTPTPTTRVIDVGGHIGYFSLLAAAHGNVIVDAFEPNLKNSLRLCESMLFNGWKNQYESSTSAKHSFINWHPYATGRSEGSNLVFREHSDPGKGRIINVGTGSGGNNNDEYLMRVVTLDGFAESRGWFRDKPDIAIFKVDVDGYEAHVMEGARKLLESHMIRNIFMEASIRTADQLQAARTSLLVLAQSGYKVHAMGEYKGPQPEGIKNTWAHVTTPQHLASQVIHETALTGSRSVNVWWSLEGQGGKGFRKF